MQRTPAGILPELAPARAEIGLPRRCVASHREGHQHQAGQRERLRRSENVLDQRAQAYAKNIYDGQKKDNEDAGQVGGVDADLHVPQHHRPHLQRGHMRNVPQPVGRRDRREKYAQKLAEGHRHRRNRSRLDHQEERPPVQKAPQWPQRLAQVNVLAARLGHHRRQLAVAQRADHGQNRRHHPRAQQKRWRAGAACNIGIDNEDARADHRTGNDGGRTEQAQALHQVRSLGRVRGQSGGLLTGT